MHIYSYKYNQTTRIPPPCSSTLTSPHRVSYLIYEWEINLASGFGQVNHTEATTLQAYSKRIYYNLLKRYGWSLNDCTYSKSAVCKSSVGCLHSKIHSNWSDGVGASLRHSQQHTRRPWPRPFTNINRAYFPRDDTHTHTLTPLSTLPPPFLSVFIRHFITTIIIIIIYRFNTIQKNNLGHTCFDECVFICANRFPVSTLNCIYIWAIERER